jgi:cell division protein FtsB
VSRPRATTIGLVLATVLAIGYVMFVPARNYLTQQAATGRTERQLDELDQQIEELQRRRVELQDPEEIARIAREEFNLVYPGEEAIALLPAPPAVLPIPAGWPFDMLRAAAAAGTETPG